MTSSFFSDPQGTLRKLRASDVDQNRLRDYIFRTSLSEGELDDALQQRYGGYSEDELGGYEPSELADVSDFPNEIPYRGYQIDPDYEFYGPIRFAAENPKVASSLAAGNFTLGTSIEEARQGLYDALRRGDITQRDLEYLNDLGRSDLLNTEEWDEDAQRTVGDLIRGVTGSNTRYEDVMPAVGDALADIDDVTSRVTSDVRLYNAARENANRRVSANSLDERLSAFSPQTRRFEPTNAVQLGLPLTPADQARATLNQYLEYPERFEDVRPARDALIAAADQVNRTANPYNVSPREAVAARVLPQVEAALGPTGTSRAVGREVANIAADEAERRNALYNIRMNLTPQDLEAEQTARALDVRPSEIDTIFDAGLSGTRIIPGLRRQLRASAEKAKGEEFQKDFGKIQDYLEKYPEVGRYLQSPIGDNPPRVERDITKLAPYVDPVQQISKPENRLALFDKMSSELGVPYERLSQLEADYTSGNPAKQKAAIDYISKLGYGEDLATVSAPALSTRTPVVGGGGYESDTEEAKQLRKRITERVSEFEALTRSLSPETREFFTSKRPTELFEGERYSYDPATGTARIDPAGDYGVKLSRYGANTGFKLVDPLAGDLETPSINALRYLADNPVTGTTSIAFTTATPTEPFSYDPKDIPKPVFDLMESFIKKNSMANLKPGTLAINSPLSTVDLINRLNAEGVSTKDSSILRRDEAFIGATPNRRGAAYRAGGFGPLTVTDSQYAYVNPEGNIVPLQPYRPDRPLAGEVSIKPTEVRGTAVIPQQMRVSQSREPLTSKAYYSVDPVAAATRGAGELAEGLRRTPSALLPGVADLIPSPEAIQTGYAQGPVAMGAQMGREFLQSLPAAAASSAVLATPAAAPLAPGIGAGLVGTAAARALNEVVRQETGEGIVPKLRQALGTAPRTGVASPARVGERPLVAQIKPLSAAQKKEATRLTSLNPLQQGIRLAQERFNPSKGEFGGSEVLKGLLDYINQKVKGR